MSDLFSEPFEEDPQDGDPRDANRRLDKPQRAGVAQDTPKPAAPERHIFTVSELTAAGVASVLVPFVASTTSHQRDNAIWMQAQKAAVHLPQGELNPHKLAQLLQSTTRDDCLRMAEAAQAHRIVGESEHIGKVLLLSAGSK